MVQDAPWVVFLAMVLVPLFMTGVAVFAGVRARRRAALIKATPKSNIGMADDGYREFEGTIEAIKGRALTSPLTKSPCVWFHAKVEESVPAKNVKTSGPIWQVVKEVTSSDAFLMRDATGACVVYPNCAEVTATDKSLWYGATKEPTDTNPPKVRPGESAKPMVEVQGGPNSKFRYSEERIYSGDPLFVLGDFATGLAVPEKILVDGEEVDDAEVDEEEVATQSAAGTKASIRSLKDDPPFILSTTPQAAHLEAMEKGGLAAFGIAVVPLAIAVAVVWARFG
jgi:hypothetical protein